MTESHSRTDWWSYSAAGPVAMLTLRSNGHVAVDLGAINGCRDIGQRRLALWLWALWSVGARSGEDET